MFSIKDLDHVVLKVTDMDRAIRFYEDVLGCKVERTVESIGLVQLRAGRALVDLVPVSDITLSRDLERLEAVKTARAKAAVRSGRAVTRRARRRSGTPWPKRSRSATAARSSSRRIRRVCLAER